jgi:hypothetical protein
LTGVQQLTIAYGEIGGADGLLELTSLPTYTEMMENGLGLYLDPTD